MVIPRFLILRDRFPIPKAVVRILCALLTIFFKLTDEGLLAPIADPGTTAHVLKSRSRSLDRNLVPWTRRRSRSPARCSGGGAENVATRAFNAALALAERRHQENMAECKRTHNAEIMRAEQRHWANLQHAEQRRQYETQQLLYQNHHQKTLLTACFQQIM